jgi:hypothetical protein
VPQITSGAKTADHPLAVSADRKSRNVVLAALESEKEPEKQAEAEGPEPSPLETALLKERLQQAKKALVKERMARANLAAATTRRIAGLRHELVDHERLAPERHAKPKFEPKRSRPTPEETSKKPTIQGLAPVIVTALMVGALVFLIFQPGALAGIASTFSLAGLPSFHLPSLDLSKWNSGARNAGSALSQPSPAGVAVSQTVLASVTPRRNFASGGSEEARAFSRLNDALQPVSAPSVQSVLGAANQWLAATGATPCTVKSPGGEVSLAISSSSKGQPLLAALSNCAAAVEHFTGAPANAGP